MEVSYYPGCSLHGMASEYDDSIRAVCDALDVTMEELADWNCCGASSAHFFDDDLALQLSARNMEIAEQAGRDLLVPCSACFQRLKHADQQLKAGAASSADASYEGRATIYHVNDFFARREMLVAIKQRVKNPLAGLAAVPYYGCLSQRPPKITEAESPENPTSMDNLLRALGIDVRPWSYKTDCCGASLTLTRTDVVHKLSGDLLDAAQEAGAECLVTDCPLCQSNLDTRQGEIETARGEQYNLPVFYLTELMALALGQGDTTPWWKKHFVDPAPMLIEKGLL